MPPCLHPERIWKINAYLILAAGALAVVWLGMLVFSLTWDLLAPRGHPSPSVGATSLTQPPPQTGQTLLYRLRSVQGSAVVLDMLSAQTVAGKYGSSIQEAGALRNQLFVQVQQGRQTRLLPQSDWLITQVVAVTAKDAQRPRSDKWRAQEDEDQPVVARFYQVVRQDSDGDQELSHNDAKTLMLARADGSGLVTLAENVRDAGGLSVLAQGGELRFVATLADGSSALYRFNLPTWQILPLISLPSLKEKQP